MGLKRLFVASICIMLFTGTIMSVEQEGAKSVESSLSADLVSSYIWRGQDMGGVSLQPGFGISYCGFSVGLWGSSSFEKEDTKEVDITVGYAYKGFSVGITDYWFDDGPGYFHYASHKTAHVYEATLGYDFGPAAINWYTNFAGNDGVTSKGKRAYSSYVQASAPFYLGGLDWSAEVGATPWATTFYNASGFAVINVGLGTSKTFAVSDMFGLTVYAKAICNPRNDKVYLVAGISFSGL